MEASRRGLLAIMLGLGCAGAASAQGLRVERPPIEVRGTIRDAGTGAPVTSFRIVPEEAGAGWPDWKPRTIDAPDGKFVIPEVTSPFHVVVPGFAPHTVWCRFLAEGRTNEVEIALKRGGSCRGLIVDASGKPIRGARVVLTDSWGKPLCETFAPWKLREWCGNEEVKIPWSWRGSSLFTFRTLEDGAWQFEHVPMRDYRIAVYAAGYACMLSDRFQVVEGRSAKDFDTTLQVAGSISVSLESERFVGMAHPIVGLSCPDTSWSGRSLPVLNRRADVGGLPPGRYRVVVYDIGNTDVGQFIRPRDEDVRTLVVVEGKTVAAIF